MRSDKTLRCIITPMTVTIAHENWIFTFNLNWTVCILSYNLSHERKMELMRTCTFSASAEKSEKKTRTQIYCTMRISIVETP